MIFDLYPLYATNTIKNGFPVYRHNSNEGGVFNYSFNGTNWELNFFFLGLIQTTLTNESPIGEFTFNILDTITAKTQCFESINLCGTLCVEIAPGVFDCDTQYFSPSISGGTIYYDNFSETHSLNYNNNTWEWL